MKTINYNGERVQIATPEESKKLGKIPRVVLETVIRRHGEYIIVWNDDTPVKLRAVRVGNGK